MSSLGIGRGSNTRTVRKIEPPRPLKTTVNSAASSDPKKQSLSPLVLPAKAIDSPEKLLLLMDAVVSGILSDDETSLKAENKSILTANIITLCESLKVSGPLLEGSLYRGQLDRAFLTFREGMVRNNLELEARVHLLGILELRECNWLPRKNSKPIIVKNLMQPLEEDTKFQTLPESTMHLGTDEVIKSSGKYRDKPSKSSKNYCKEEIIIRNADSGKVMGIKGRRVHMIEKLSDTIISFQKVQPSFKERLVQITGPSEEKISYAAHLIEDTIRNNSSPVRELGDSELSYSSDESYEKQVPGDDTSINWKYSSSSDKYQYKHKVTYNDCVLMLTGSDYDFVTLAKEVLDDYFSKLGKSESFDNYSESENMIGVAGEYLENDVFVEPNVYLDDVLEFSNHNGAGDTQEDPLLGQLHKDLNGLEIETEFESSPANEIISISDSVEEVEEEAESSTRDIIFPRLVYTKEFLLGCRKNPICQKEPENFNRVKESFPKIIKSDLRTTSSTPSSSFSPVTSENNAQTET